MKKLLATALGATLIASQSIAAVAAPAPVERAGSPIGDSEGAISGVLIAVLFAAVAAGVVVAVESSEDNDAPTSP